MLVWKAISSMAFAIFVICWALPLMSSMAEERADICSLAPWMRRVISSVWARVWPLLSVTSASRSFTWATSLTSSSVDWFCSSEAWCSWADWPLSCSAMAVSRSAAARNPRRVSFIDWVMVHRLARMSTKSPL